MGPGLPPELNARQNTIRQIVVDECVPLEPEYLAHPPQEGVKHPGAPRGIQEAVPGILGTLSRQQWDRLHQLSKETGIYTSFVPQEYGGGTSEIHKFVMARGLLNGRVSFQG